MSTGQVVTAPVAGQVRPLAAVPDPVFAQLMVGPGLAIDPVRAAGVAVSPVDGQLVALHPHAFVVTDAAGRGVLVHLGIDTVQLGGTGFTLLIDAGAEVRTGQPVIGWDPAAVEAAGRSPLCPVVALDAAPDDLTDLLTAGPVTLGTPLFHRR